jgi:RNA polymerase sigma-70 factor (ECF subfamily)
LGRQTNKKFLVQGNKETEFLELIGKHQGIVHKICSLYEPDQHLRQDVFQEIVIQLWKNFGKFRQESSFSTWLYRVALNTAISYTRIKKRHINTTEIDKVGVTIADLKYDNVQEEQLQQLYTSMHHLSDLERAIIMLYLEDKSYKEMEEIFGIKEATIRVKMNRVKEKLRKILKLENNAA